MITQPGTAALEKMPAPLPILEAGHHETFEMTEFDHPCDDVSLAGALAVVSLYRMLGDSWTSNGPPRQTAGLIFDPSGASEA